MAFRKESELPLGMTPNDLPAWMRRSRREIDWAFLVALVMCVVVAWPLITRSGLPRNEGIRADLARTVEMAESIQSGILYPRWASNFNYGYGSPLWNYLAPLPHYLTGMHYVLAQSNPETSIKLVLISSILLAGIGMFSFARRRWGVYGGLLAASLYLFNPQMALVKPYLQSDLAVTLAMGMFPVMLWAFDRLLTLGRGRDLGLAACILAALWLTSTPLNSLLVAVALGWLVWTWRVIRPDHACWGRVALGIVCGTVMTAFYWLPAVAERQAVRWLAVSELKTMPPFSLNELLAPPALLDLSAINPLATISLGVPVWVFAVLTLIVIIRQAWRLTPPHPRRVSRGEAFQWRLMRFLSSTTSRQREALYFVLLGGILLFTLSQIAGVGDNPLDWSSINLHDALPVVIACWSIGAAQVGDRLSQSRHVRVAGGIEVICLVIVLVAALPVLYPPTWPERYFVPDLSTVLMDETRGYTAGSQVAGVLLPRSVQGMPALSRMLMESYESQMIDKVARDLLPAATQVDIIEHRPQSDRLVTRSSNETLLTLLTFNYPGWRAQIDNNSVPVISDPTSGFITIQIPPGRHEVEVYLGTTSARLIGWILAFATLLIVVSIAFRDEYFRRERRVVSEPLVMMPSVHYAVFFVAALVFGLGATLPHLVPDWFTTRSSRGEVKFAEQLPRALQGGIDLLGYDIEYDSFSPGDEIEVTLYWRAVRPNLPDYQVNLSIVAADNPEYQVGLVQHRHPGMVPSSLWSDWPLLDSYVRDVYYISVQEDAAAGEYQIMAQVGPCSQATIFPCETIDPLFVRDGRGTSLGQRIVLPAVIELTPGN